MSFSKEDIQDKIENINPTILGVLMYYVFPVRRNVVTSNMRTVFGDSLSHSDIEHLAKCFYSHLLKGFFENIIVSWMSKKAIRNKIRVEGMNYLMSAAEKGKGALILTGHFGNWELAPVAGVLHFPQFYGRLHILRRQIVNKTIEKILFRRFYDVGLDVIPKRNSVSRVMDALSQNHAVAFIMDQYAKPGKEGIVVDFFNKSAGTFKSLAVVARSSESPVIPAVSWREKDGSHVMKFFEPLEWISSDDSDEEIMVNTKRYNEILESFILSHPEQWLWLHKRWKVKAHHQRVKSNQEKTTL